MIEEPILPEDILGAINIPFVDGGKIDAQRAALATTYENYLLGLENAASRAETYRLERLSKIVPLSPEDLIPVLVGALMTARDELLWFANEHKCCPLDREVTDEIDDALAFAEASR